MAFRPRADLPKLGSTLPSGPVALDSNVFINALTARGPLILRALVADRPDAYVSASTLAELSWMRGRLDQNHPETRHVLARVDELLSRIHPGRALVPSSADWLAAGELAGKAARAIIGGGRKMATAFDRVELISDALTAIVAREIGATVITEDADFDVLMRLLPGLDVLFYDRVTKAV